MTTFAVPLGRGHRLRLTARLVVVVVALVALAGVAAFAGLCLGDGWSPPGDVLAALVGRGPLSFVVPEWRLPRVLAALVFGAALALSGAVFQSLTRNPLGTPDMIGLNAGAYTGALLAVTLGGGLASGAAGTTGAELDGLGVAMTAGAALGAVATGALVLLLAAGPGATGLRLVVVGIGLNAMLTAVNSWIILRADVDVALAVTAWGIGSLNGTDWSDLGAPFAIIGGLVAVLVVLARPLQQTALGDELAITSGVDLRRLRVVLVVVGVALTATVTAVAGPIVFVALAAPQVGRRLVGAPGVPLLPAALVGAVLLASSDVVAQALLAPILLPVGVVTTAVGGAYLLWLLVREVRR